MSARTAARRRLGSIRLSLILLALVPSVTLAAIWGVTTTQMFAEGLRLRHQTELSRSTGAMGTDATLALQRERGLSAAWLASPHGSRAALDAQRRTTDAALAKLQGRSAAVRSAPTRISERMYSVIASTKSLEYYRGQVDRLTDITADQVLDQYTSIIDDQIQAFQELSQVDDGDLTSQAGPLLALEHAAELVSQEDAQLTLAWPSGRLDDAAWTDFTQLVGAQRWVVRDQVLPSLRGDAKARAEQVMQGPDWATLRHVEDQVFQAGVTGRTAHREVLLPDTHQRWDEALDRLSAQYADLIRQQTAQLLDRSADKADSLLAKAGWLSAGGLLALLVCVVLSWRITRSLSRRLRGLREATLSLAQRRLPDVVARLDRGEKVDVDEATPPLDYGHDELGQVAQAFNTAQRTAVHTAVELADTRRGFQKVILGIARQSQNLVNLQLSKLDALEREHEDPKVLAGLYALDSNASQLRRYEENLVIISGEQPRRSWTEPVALIDILRSAVGEVAQYQRVEVLADEEVWLAPPAVADVIHLLAELIDNATAYSPAPSPVGVRAATVAKGLAIEIEDRGLGMSEEEYEAFNAQLAEAPQFDVVALADDLRLGMFVVARLAVRHGVGVTLRSSPYGGTTAIVLVPEEIVVRDRGGPPKEASAADADTAAPGGADTAAGETEDGGFATALTGQEGRSAQTPPDKGRPAPLPRRVPQTSLAAELLADPPEGGGTPAEDEFSAEEAAASLAGFQRGTRAALAEGPPAGEPLHEADGDGADGDGAVDDRPVPVRVPDAREPDDGENGEGKAASGEP
ncbi:nitrate- and nitrite sensing domain-containing protein [Streptomyces sp. C1-2]|uniref:sensor histidine kinase n=1 Tax=Streptomyces sp. C1-2 TaxID=2720022 RepID=UPI00143248CC|nr:nitrate- and nitrite sensing domain-containing protein [Streptomyces sp. C1-2]NJP73962.1 sensor histidine kinase [Streptomyces sp. C1-2]